MLDILFARTFLIVASMLCLTAVTAKANRYFETKVEMWATVIISFLLLFLILGFSDSFPLNIGLVAGFSLAVGWSIGPTIEYFGTIFKLKKYLRDQGIELGKDESPTDEQMEGFEASFDKDAYHKEWQNTVFQAVLGTAIAVAATAGIVFLTDIDFGFLGSFLFISLIILVAMGLINVFFIKSRMLSLIRAYAGAVIFTLYLLYDFDQLQKHAGDESWSTAIEISVHLYLDIINLFLDLLQILAEFS